MHITLEALRAIVGPTHVLTGDDVISRSVDWMTGAPCQAGAIVRPADTEQVAAVMRACHQVQQPVVTHGGLTGLVHGAEASPDELVISLERMTAIEEIDQVGGTLSVQAGAPLQRVQEAAKEVGLQFPLDLGARGSCTIGGNIATNAGGVRVIRYGMMRQQVLGLEAVMADGRVVSSMNHMLKNNAGFDLKQLFIGSEGTLGIVTRAVLRLQPPTPSEQTAMVACPSFEALTGLLSHMGKALGGGLGAFEVMWQNHYRLLTETLGRHTPPIATEHPFYVIIDSLGSDTERNATQFSEALESALESELIVDAVIAQSTTQRDGLWAIREDIEGLVKGLAPVLTFDVSLPIADMQRYTNALEAQLTQRWAEAKLVVFGHLGDGNLHISVSVGSAEIEVRREVEAMVYQPLATLGGSVSAEHGIGLEKRPWLATCRSSAEIELMHTLKQALDPHRLLNRGKILS
ncbi:FAD-binding oxidoreductase [Halomonas sp. ATBC28]|jgi:FAD/FMN-containing dehydrogenase|uniref:FAD-binding, type 2 n=1 Tax=Vreelandella titanicae BH1 TaxID=1204738 RepID=L9UB98_9GAMM|nr:MULTISPECIES: FAD-binding oxidoreductase [Halomonas]ELY21906.1 FAD-binding, type 2 [Halomonas titanicae BH1]NVE90071.1 FAD-binding oxidoreductase [Halomonas titanicae]TMU14784.1 FAD-binding oxidoreductase [Halomonas sp. ATBC28]